MWTGGGRTKAWTMAFYDNVASIDVRNCFNNTTNITNPHTFSGTTASANETLLSVMFNGNAGNKTFTPPANTQIRWRAPNTASPAQVMLVDEYAVANGSNTSRTFTTSVADTGVGCTLSLVPN